MALLVHTCSAPLRRPTMPYAMEAYTIALQELSTGHDGGGGGGEEWRRGMYACDQVCLILHQRPCVHWVTISLQPASKAVRKCSSTGKQLPVVPSFLTHPNHTAHACVLYMA